MALRLVEITMPSDMAPELREELETVPGGAPFQETLADGQVRVRLLLKSEQTGPIIDAINGRFGQTSGFQLFVLSVVAALPRLEDEAFADPAIPGPSSGEPIAGGVSREELYHDIGDMTGVTRIFVATVILSTVVATIGLLRDNVAVIIGAMVIAPLLGPNVALAFASTLGDTKLIRRSAAANLVGVLIAFAITAIVGLLYTGDLGTIEILSRTSLSVSDIVLALAAGGAGALAMTSGISTALTGVMVAVALLPPTAVAGLLFGAGEWELAAGAALLLATNVISVNLAGVVVFVVQGVNPHSWWDKDRARRSVRVAVAVWVVLLLLLGTLILLPGVRTSSGPPGPPGSSETPGPGPAHSGTP